MIKVPLKQGELKPLIHIMREVNVRDPELWVESYLHHGYCGWRDRTFAKQTDQEYLDYQVLEGKLEAESLVLKGKEIGKFCEVCKERYNEEK